jgi:Fanconi anemia group J protein
MSLSPSRVSSGGSGPTRPESSSTSVAVGTSTPVRARVPATSGSSNYSSPQRCLQFDAVPHPDALYVDGINIYYPENKKPFDPQRKLSECIIRALKNKQNALLESPTGTGKTLALLSSTLSWLRHTRLQTPHPSSNGKSNKTSTIFYCSRTHSQLKQVAEELRLLHPNCIKDIKMVMLGAKEKMCQNETAKNAHGVSVEVACSDLRAGQLCPLMGNIAVVQAELNKAHIWDLEDALQTAANCSGCAYYGSRLIMDAGVDIALVTYNHLIDPGVRRTMNIDLRDAIVIIDEGHNLEHECGKAATCELTNRQIDLAMHFLSQLSGQLPGSREALCLHHFVCQFGKWLKTTGDNLRIAGSRMDAWAGSSVLNILKSQYGLTRENIEGYMRQYAILSADRQEDGNGQAQMHGNHPLPFKTDVVIVLKTLFKVLKFMLSENSLFADEYRIVVNADPKDAQDCLCTVTFHCLSASVAFSDIASKSHSVLVTSGTLAPLNSFAGRWLSAPQLIASSALKAV